MKNHITKTVQEAAAELGISDSRVRKLCIDHGIGKHRGCMRFLSASDMKKLAAARKPVGRPKKSSKKLCKDA